MGHSFNGFFVESFIDETLGEANRGLMHMFTMMNAARHAVGGGVSVNG
ncbi:MAG: hypothetical protein HC933_07375 [Pleurocapsa sp. SU_196_0]|nr:hypothetical protein [Pleurocapsa sp. SU_196_0]